jgi:hypothetical protein
LFVINEAGFFLCLIISADTDNILPNYSFQTKISSRLKLSASGKNFSHFHRKVGQATNANNEMTDICQDCFKISPRWHHFFNVVPIKQLVYILNKA